jgi:hypothetical protein
MRTISQHLIQAGVQRITTGVSPAPEGLAHPSPRVRLATVDAHLAEAEQQRAADPRLAWLLVAEARHHTRRILPVDPGEALLLFFAALDLSQDHPEAAWAVVAAVRRWLRDATNSHGVV